MLIPSDISRSLIFKTGVDVKKEKKEEEVYEEFNDYYDN